MQPMGEVRRHFLLTLGMAQRAGVDLAQAMRDGVVSPRQYAAAVTACRSCAAPDRCAEWLDSPLAKAGNPPDYCMNRDLLLAVRGLTGPSA